MEQMSLEEYREKYTPQLIPSKEKKLILAQRKKERELPLNKMQVEWTERENGTLRIQFSYDNCPTLTEQHTARDTDLNYLMSKYRPDELATYIAARTAHKREIMGHDFADEPSLQDAMNQVYSMKQEFMNLPEEIRKQFPNHVEFLRFIDNKANQDKMVEMGLLKPKQIEKLTGEKPKTSSAPEPSKTTKTTTTKEAKAKEE